MSVTLAKSTDAHVQAQAPDWNEGAGTLTLIGGMPLRKVNGAVIRLTGATLLGESIRAVLIEELPSFSGWAKATYVMEDGSELRTGLTGELFALRDGWIRRALTNGNFAGVARMR